MIIREVVEREKILVGVKKNVLLFACLMVIGLNLYTFGLWKSSKVYYTHRIV